MVPLLPLIKTEQVRCDSQLYYLSVWVSTIHNTKMNAGHFLRLKNKIAIAPKKCTTSDTLTCFNKICLLVHVVSQVFFCKAISTIKRQERVLLSDGKLNIFVRQSWRNKFNCPPCGQKTPKVRKSRKEIVVERKTPQFPFEVLTFNMS